MLTWSLGCAPSPARLAITSLAFMFEEVPEPVWKTSTGNWSSCSPAATASPAAAIRSARSASRIPSSPLTVAAAAFRRPSQRTTGHRHPLARNREVVDGLGGLATPELLSQGRCLHEVVFPEAYFKSEPADLAPGPRPRYREGDAQGNGTAGNRDRERCSSLHAGVRGALRRPVDLARSRQPDALLQRHRQAQGPAEVAAFAGLDWLLRPLRDQGRVPAPRDLRSDDRHRPRDRGRWRRCPDLRRRPARKPDHRERRSGLRRRDRRRRLGADRDRPSRRPTGPGRKQAARGQRRQLGHDDHGLPPCVPHEPALPRRSSSPSR